MKLKRNIQIATMTRYDIVRLVSTAVEGSEFLAIDYDRKFYDALEKKPNDVDESVVSKLAFTLLRGGNAYFYDTMSEGEVHSRYGETVRDETFGDCTLYKIDAEILARGLEDCGNGCYDEFAQKAFDRLAADDVEFDHEDAERLMQCILFGEEVYA